MVLQLEVSVRSFASIPRNRVLCLLLSIGVQAAFAQEPPKAQTFDVASVKLHPGIGNVVRIQPLPGGRLVADSCSLRFLIQSAYGVQNSQISGGPGWLASDRFDIEAKADGSPSDAQMVGPMLRVVLEDRFKLVVHREQKQLPVYELQIVGGGPKSPRSKPGGCIPPSSNFASAREEAGTTTRSCGFAGFGIDGLSRKLEMAGVTMAEVAAALSRLQLGRTVIDKTGRDGDTFDIRLNWAVDAPLEPTSDANTDGGKATGPSIFTALSEELGLRLVPAKAPVEVLLIDHAERPSAN